MLYIYYETKIKIVSCHIKVIYFQYLAYLVDDKIVYKINIFNINFINDIAIQYKMVLDCSESKHLES